MIESDLCRGTDMGDQVRYIHLKEISVDFIKRRPTSILEVVLEDDAGVKHKSNKFKEGELVRWSLDTYIRTHTSARLSIWRPLFNISVAEISVEFKPNEFGDDRAVGLEDIDHRVTVNFMCGRSQSLADVTRVLGSVLKSDQLDDSPPSAHLPVAPPIHATIHSLNDDILLDIFNCYRLDDQLLWNFRLGWRKLSHVCQRWRHLMFEFAFHLGMHIECTNGTLISDILDHLPPLPLFVNYDASDDDDLTASFNPLAPILTEQDELGIYHTLRLRNRVRQIHLDLPSSILQKVLVFVDGHFPILEHLSLSFSTKNNIPLTLPETFLAPNLRHLTLPGISPPKLLRFLTTTVSLATLKLGNIQTSCYFHPRPLVAHLGSLLQLEELSIEFSTPIPRPGTEREPLGEEETSVMLPNLKTFQFKGMSAYLECLVAQISAPLLEQLHITLFSQIAFSLPQLSHLINITEAFKLPKAMVYFDVDEVRVRTAHRLNCAQGGGFLLRVMGMHLDSQVDRTTQICNALVPTLSSVEHLTLGYFSRRIQTGLRPGVINSTTWHTLLRLFIGTKELHIAEALLKRLSRALQADEIGLDPGFLPDLKSITARTNLFSSFIDTRQIVGRPVWFSSSWSRPK